MSYYTSSTLLDYGNTTGYGGGVGGGSTTSASRYDSLFGSSLTGGSTSAYSSYGLGSTGSAGSSAIDRYYSFLDDISSPSGGIKRQSASTTSNYGLKSSTNSTTDHYSMPNRYSSRYLSSDHSAGSASSGASSSSGYSSSISSRYGSSTDYQPMSSRYSRPMISRAPTYDKYGKELSNYERWRSQHGEIVDSLNNNKYNSNDNNNSGSDAISRKDSTSSHLSNIHSRRRISRIEDDSGPSMGSSGSILNTSRELSVMPGASVANTFENELTASLPSRFANMTTGGSTSSRGDRNDRTGSNSSAGTTTMQRGKSLAPTSSSTYGSNGGYSASFGGKSSNYSSSSSTDRASASSKIVHSFPLSVSSKLAGYEVRDVKGDGGCYYRCLSVYFTGSEENYNKHRREVVGYMREHMDNYSSMIRSEIGYASTNDYFSRKMRTDHQEFAETTEIIATCCFYNINIHVLALVPGKRTWEWLHFDPSIGSGKPSTATRDIYLYNQGSVHFMLCSPK